MSQQEDNAQAHLEPKPKVTPTGRQEFILFAYTIVLLLLVNVANTGLKGPAYQSILQKTLNLPATTQSIFGFITDIPSFLGFLFGFLRDRWKPLNRGDRGYFLLLPVLMAGVNFALAAGHLTYSRFLWLTLLAGIVGTMAGAATNGLLTAIAQYNGTAGRFSVLLLVIPRLVGMGGNYFGGKLGDAAHQHLAFTISGVLCLPLILLGFWKPPVAFAHEQDTEIHSSLEDVWQSVRRLLRHRIIFLPVLIQSLWAFAPGWGTPLNVYLIKHIGLSEETYGSVMAALGAGTLVSSLGYTLLCIKLRLRPLLYWGTLLGVIGCPLFLFIHTPQQAYILSFLAGVSLSVGLCSFNDLIIRCCPTDLEGAAFLLVGAISTLAADTSDLFGSWLYEKGGFGLALVVSTLFTAAIFIVLPFVPKAVTAHREGERLTAAVSDGATAAVATSG